MLLSTSFDPTGDLFVAQGDREGNNGDEDVLLRKLSYTFGRVPTW